MTAHAPRHALLKDAPQPTRRNPRALLAAIAMILVWLAVGGLGGPLFGRISEVSSNDATTFLPTSADSTQVQKALPGFLGGTQIPAVVVAERPSGLTPADMVWLQALPA